MAGARALAAQALKDDPKLGLAHEGMGFVNFSDGKDTEAQSEFSQAHELDPTLWLSLFAKTMMSPIAMSYVPADEATFHNAVAKVLALDPQFAAADVQLARLYVRQNDLKAAYAVARKAEQLEPSRARYHLLSGQILRRRGKGAEAAEFAKFLADRWPGADHEEAVERWNAIPAEQRPVGKLLSEEAPKDTQVMEGLGQAVSCALKGQATAFAISCEGKTFAFHPRGGRAPASPTPSGTAETISAFAITRKETGPWSVSRLRRTPATPETSSKSKFATTFRSRPQKKLWRLQRPRTGFFAGCPSQICNVQSTIRA